jgi:hypothetical protein
MHARKTLCSLLLCACTGCLYTSNVERGWGVFADSFRNLAELPFYGTAQVAEAHRNRKLARQAWDEVCPTFQTPPSKDYANGFKIGYADYLDAGGTGEPPPYPPFCYREACYQNAEGQKAVHDWYAGFRHGAAVARASGLRETFILPLSALPDRNERPYLPVGVPNEKEEFPAGAPAQLLPPRMVP